MQTFDLLVLRRSAARATAIGRAASPGARLKRLVLLQRLESLHGFTVAALGVDTRHNATMDYITRATAPQVRREMSRQGFLEVDLAADWERA